MEGKQTLQNEILSVKVKFNEDIRRLSCPINTTFDALRTEVLAKYGLDTNTRLCLKYEDEEGDLITLGSEADLKEALQIVPATKLLRLNLVKGKQAHKHEPVEAVAVAPQSPVIPANTTVQSTGVPGDTISKDEFKRLKKEIKHHHKDHKDHDDKIKAKEAKHAMKGEFKKQKEAAKAMKGAKNVARFVKDVATPDETEVAPGTPFVKTWRFRNEGTTAWPENCQLVFVSKLNGDQMGAPASVPVPSAHVGQELDISVPMIAPTAPGRYVGYWRLCSGDGKKFGQRVRVLIQVAASSSSSDSASTSSSSGDEHAEMASALRQLEQLGFTDKELNARVLKKHHGNVESARACLVKKQERKAEKAKKKAEKAAAKEAAKKQKKASKSATNTPRK